MKKFLCLQKISYWCLENSTQIISKKFFHFGEVHNKLSLSLQKLFSTETVNYFICNNFCRFTRKPCYRKDDRAMRPIYGCPEKF